MTNERDTPHENVRRHRECWEQLPWLVNDTLAPRERARVEAHLQTCAECQEELAAQQRLKTAMRTDESIVLAPQASLHKLIQRIDSELAEPLLPTTHASSSEAASRTPSWARWAAIAASVQAIALTVLLATELRSAQESLHAARFETLTTASAPSPNANVIRVVFGDDMSLRDVNALLRGIEATVVAGPSEAGVYTLSFATDERAAMEATIARLRADKRVLFAEIALTRGTP